MPVQEAVSVLETSLTALRQTTERLHGVVTLARADREVRFLPEVQLAPARFVRSLSQRLRDEVSLEAMRRLAVRHLSEYDELFEHVSVELGLGEDDLS
jgi:hypothetical protein